jgi:hypothetical protein
MRVFGFLGIRRQICCLTYWILRLAQNSSNAGQFLLMFFVLLAQGKELADALVECL